MKKNEIIKNMCLNAAFASIYVVLVLVLGDFSFGFANGIISIRIAEIIVPLCMFDKRFIPGAIIGCLISNIIGGNVIDMIVGTIQTCLTVGVLYFIKPRQLAVLLGSLICGVCIGLEIYLLGFSAIGLWIILTTFIGEYIILEIGYLLTNKLYYKYNNV